MLVYYKQANAALESKVKTADKSNKTTDKASDKQWYEFWKSNKTKEGNEDEEPLLGDDDLKTEVCGWVIY